METSNVKVFGHEYELLLDIYAWLKVNRYDKWPTNVIKWLGILKVRMPRAIPPNSFSNLLNSYMGKIDRPWIIIIIQPNYYHSG